MKVILLGTGGPKPDPDRCGPALVVQTAGRSLLVDAGRGVVTRLAAAGIDLLSLDSVLITHHHFDHISSLGDLILTAWNMGRKKTLPIFGPPGTSAILDALIHQVYRSDIEFRRREAERSGVPLVDIRQMVQCREVSAGTVFADSTLRVEAGFVEHGHGLGFTQEVFPCRGYRIESEGETVAVSGDTVDCPGLDALAQKADILVLCCYLSAGEITDPEARLVAAQILTCAPDAGRIATRAGVRKLVLTHMRRKTVTSVLRMIAEIRCDFTGEVIAGEDQMEIECRARSPRKDPRA